MNLLNYTTDEALNQYLTIASKYKEFNTVEIKDLSIGLVKCYTGSKKHRDYYKRGLKVEVQWYNSLNNGSPDYSVYDNIYYIADLWACWRVYSHKYLSLIASKNAYKNSNTSVIESLVPVSAVIDMGNGFGITTALLKQMFPNATAYGVNIENTWQYKVSEEYGKMYNFRTVNDCSCIHENNAIVFASEYFEHIINPIEHLIDIVRKCNPKGFIIANSFGAKSIGHFDYYYHNGKKIQNRLVGRLFNKELRAMGYFKQNTKFWNNRPTIWIKL